MEKYAWKAKIRENSREEYIRRHNEIWPEMKKVLHEAGICNYSIWMCGEDLFGYYECEKGVEYASRVQRESPIVQKWDAYMADILMMEPDPQTGAQPMLEQVFELQ